MGYSDAPVLSFEKAVKRFDPKKLDASEIQCSRDLSYWQKYQKNEPKTEETLSQAKNRGQ